MENGLESLYMIVGVVIFIAAMTILMYMDTSMNYAYKNVLYNSIDSSIIYEERNI